MDMESITRELAALDQSEPDPHVTYSIEITAHLTRVPKRLIAVCCRHGLVSPATDPEDAWYFNADAVRTLRRIDFLRNVHGMNLAAIRTILELMREVEHLRDELRFQRGH